MKTILSSETTDILDGVKIKVHTKIIEIEGSCGNLICNFKLLLQLWSYRTFLGILEELYVDEIWYNRDE
ncbi:hypothetical protein C1H46_009215 [Malus baccata]|uniref:Uncharacterized protein n=1 Tax=Malus baccata TaxID=106549 RepID=A0A540N2F2_MALBA|nr:hypothetical protein C1H46_009215 [Malus baccata]